MSAVFRLSIDCIKFWYIDAPTNLIKYFSSLNGALSKLLSLGVLSRTFWKPWKNEYREGLVGFSIAIGVFMKSFVILFDIVILLCFSLLEGGFLLLFLAWPLATLYILFK